MVLKNFFVGGIFCFCLLTCSKEEPSPFPTDVDIYISGTIFPFNSGSVACYWKNGNIVRLTDGKLSAQATAIVVTDSIVYVAGYQDYSTTGIGVIPEVAKYWKNGVEVNLTDGTYDAQANSIAVSGNDIYVAGYENNVVGAGFPIAKYWKNGVPVILGDGIAYSILVLGTDVYVGGENSNGAVIWKNGVANQLTDGSQINGIAVSGSDLYATGYQWNGSINEYSVTIAKLWKNGVAVNLTDGTTFGDARRIFISGSDVYVAGDEEVLAPASSKSTCEYWKNGVPVTLSKDVNSISQVWAVVPVGANIYATGINADRAVCWINSKPIILADAGFGQGLDMVVIPK